MVMIPHPKGAFSMDGYLVDNLDIAKKAIKKDWDMLFAVDGRERSGKSVMATQMAYYCDPTFNISQVCMTGNEFKDAIKSAKPQTAVVYDEAFTGLSSRNAMTRINKTIVEMLAEIGQKNLFIFVVMPTFFNLDTYVALWRSSALIHVYTGEGYERGFFMFYNEDLKKDLFVYGKKTYSYKDVRPNFYGCFTNFYVVDETLYRKKKLDSLMNKEKPEAIDEKVYVEWLFNRLSNPELNFLNITQKSLILGITTRTYYHWIEKRKQNEPISLENEGFEGIESEK